MLIVRQIWRYPVKSMGGERLDVADVDTTGIDGDRAWGIRDCETGNILTGRREPELLMAAARLVDGRPVISARDGHELATSEELSAWLGRPVELVPAGSGPGTFENPMDAINETDWVSWEGPDDTFHDSARAMVSLVSTTTLVDYEPARFRINLIVDGGGEDELVGRRLRVGDLDLDVSGRISRCVMVSRAQPGIAKDIDVLQRVIRERDNRLGIGALVASPGRIAVGDIVTIG